MLCTRQKKADFMKRLIESVHGESTVYNVQYVKELKLKQVGLHYKESIIEDNMTSLKLRSELLSIQSEEIQQKLILLQHLEQIHKAKESQLNNGMNAILKSMETKTETMSSKQLARDALAELHRLQKLEMTQQNTIRLTEDELKRIDGEILHQMEKQSRLRNKNYKKTKMRRDTSYELESESDSETEFMGVDHMEFKEKVQAIQAELKKVETRKIALEEEWDKNNELIDEKSKILDNLQSEISETNGQKSELQQKIQQCENMIHSLSIKRHNSGDDLAKNEFIAEIEFMNKEYRIKMDQINNRYREKQTFLKNKFVTEYTQKIKKNTKNRQAQIEQESYQIIAEQKDKEMIVHLTEKILAANDEESVHQQPVGYAEESMTFRNKTKCLRFRFGKNVIVSDDRNDHDEYEKKEDDLLQIVLRPIKFVWSENDDDTNDAGNDNEEEESLNVHSDISTDLSGDDMKNEDEDAEMNEKNVLSNFKNLFKDFMHSMDDGNLYDALEKQMDADKDDDDGDKQNVFDDDGCLHYDNINMVKELLLNWSLTQTDKIEL